MKSVVITGATSGIGMAFAKRLSAMGYRVILVGRNEEKLSELSAMLPDSEKVCMDLSERENCFELFDRFCDADMLINSAGCGVFGEASDTSLADELEMLDINITALHILTKLYLKEFVRRDSGCILNIASSAAFFPGPLFSSYYASKAYVYRLTTSIHDELKKTNVKVSVLCPGPVDTDFNRKAGVNAGKGAVTADYVVDTALKKLGKRVIVPGFAIRCTRLFSKICPEKYLSAINYRLQKSKMNNR